MVKAWNPNFINITVHNDIHIYKNSVASRSNTAKYLNCGNLLKLIDTVLIWKQKTNTEHNGTGMVITLSNVQWKIRIVLLSVAVFMYVNTYLHDCEIYEERSET